MWKYELQWRHLEASKRKLGHNPELPTRQGAGDLVIVTGLDTLPRGGCGSALLTPSSLCPHTRDPRSTICGSESQI